MPLSALTEQLQQPPPAAMRTLSPADASDLARKVRHARLVQTRALVHSLELTIKQLPWPLRKAVMKAVGL